MNHQASEKKDNIEKPVMPPPLKLERMPSIDEPKTLLHDEMTMAREEALNIIKNHTKEEALKIFLTGLVPVETTENEKKEDVGVEEKEDVGMSDCDDE